MINTDLSRLKEWRAIRGFDNQFTLTFLLNGLAFDVSSYTFTVNIRKIGSDTNVLQLTQGAGVTNGGATGIVTILLDNDDSQTIAAREFFYEIVYQVGSFSNRLLQGTFNLLDDYNSASPSESATIPVNLEGTDVNLVINLAGGSGNALQFQNEGSDLGTPDVDTLDFVGALITAARVGDKVTVTVTTPNKSDVGLGNVDNTSDVNKPVSTAQAAADAAVLSSANALANTKVDSVTGDGVNNADPNNPVIDLTQSRTVTGADSIVQADSLKVIYFNSATPFNFTIDQLNADSQTSFVNIGAGTVSFVNGTATASGITSLTGGTNATAVILYRTATNPVIIAGATTVSGAALTKTDDTNVTLSLGGTPTTALLQATSLTLGWTGTLAYARFVDGSALSVVGRASNTSGVQASITAGSDFNILRRSGTSIGFGSIDLSQSGAVGSSILPIANGGTGASSFPGWLLASGGTLTGVNTITHGTANGLIFTGSPTFSATGHYHTQFTPTAQFGSNASHLQGLVNIGGSGAAGVNSQVMNGVVINTSFTFGAFTRASYSNRLLAVLGTNSNGLSVFIDAFTNTNNILRITDPSGVTTTEWGADSSGGFITSNSGKTFFINTGSSFRFLIAGSRNWELATNTLDVSRTIGGPSWSGTAVTSTATQLGSASEFGFQGRFWTGAAAVTGWLRWNFVASTSVNQAATSDLRFWNGSATTDIWRIAADTGRMFLGGITDPTAVLHIAAGTTARSQLRLSAGVAPTSPNDGDIYYIDTNDRLMFRKNATDAEVISASAVTTEVVVSDTTLTVTYNGTTYKLLARA